MTCMRIDGRLVGPSERTLVIAEIGVNHDGSVDRALQLVQHAADAGADAVKLQIFQASSLMHASSSFAKYQADTVSAATPSDMLRQYELSNDDLRRVVGAIVERKMIPLATPFSPGDVDTIESLGLPAMKIASPDLVNRLLLARAAGANRPIIVSTGAATTDEIQETVKWLIQWRARFALMHCVSSYPTPPAEARLGWIEQLKGFDAPVGYSDHTTDVLTGALAVAAGACIVEKHLTYDRAAGGPDHSASADPQQFAQYVQLIRQAEILRGSGSKHVLPIERDVRMVSRQSLVLVHDIAIGQQLRMNDLTVQRPGTGIPPADVTVAIGRIAKRPLRKGTMLQWEMLSDAAV